MTKKQQKILDEQIQYICKYDENRIYKIRQALNILPNRTFLQESETIESLFKKCLDNRKEFKTFHYSASTSGWTVEYFPDKKKYKKNEDFKLRISFSFVETDNFE